MCTIYSQSLYIFSLSLCTKHEASVRVINKNLGENLSYAQKTHRHGLYLIKLTHSKESCDKNNILEHSYANNKLWNVMKVALKTFRKYRI